MSLLGTKQSIRLTVQPLLDAIAPECTTNKLECDNNPAIDPIGWQDAFFSKKIHEALNLNVMELNGAWEDDTPEEQKLTDIISYLKNGTASPSFLEYINSLLHHAPEYIQGIHTLVQSKFDDPKQLDCYEPKALIAFCRMVNIVLAYNALQLHPNVQIRKALENTIEQLSKFSVRERIMFRYHKAVETTLAFDAFRSEDNSELIGGKAYDSEYERTLFALKNLSLHPVSPVQATHGFLQGSLGIIKDAFLFPVVKMQQFSRFVNQVTAFPLRAIKATTQDIPVIGKVVGFTAEGLNTVKDLALPAAEVGALSWMSMLECCKMLGLTPEAVDPNTLLSFMDSASPYLTYGLGAYGIVAGICCTAKIAYVGASSLGATYRGITSGKDLMQAIIDENQAIFREHILTEENIAEKGWRVLNTPIIVPEDLKVILSEADQNEIIRQVSWGRLDIVRDLFPDLQESSISVVRDRAQGIARPVYLPLQQAYHQPVPEVEAQMLADLRLDDENALAQLAQSSSGRRTTF
jgi:hypothetical protein